MEELTRLGHKKPSRLCLGYFFWNQLPCNERFITLAKAICRHSNRQSQLILQLISSIPCNPHKWAILNILPNQMISGLIPNHHLTATSWRTQASSVNPQNHEGYQHILFKALNLGIYFGFLCQFQSVWWEGASHATPSNSQIPAGCPRIELSSDAIYQR